MRVAAAERQPDAGAHAARNFLAAIPLPDGAIISIYHPLKDELDTWPLAAALIQRGNPIALPVTVGKKRPLIFRIFQEGDPLIADNFGVMTPQASAAEATPMIVVTPLLAFTRGGGRLGYGGGFYDRTLAKLRAESDILAVGFAYGAQEVDALPLDPHDQLLDWIVTEREAIEVGNR